MPMKLPATKKTFLSSFSNSWMLYCWKYWVAYFLLVQVTVVLTPLFFLCSVSLHLTLLSNTLPWTFPQCFCFLSLSVLILRIFYTACWNHHFQVMTILNIYLFVCLFVLNIDSALPFKWIFQLYVSFSVYNIKIYKFCTDKAEINTGG